MVSIKRHGKGLTLIATLAFLAGVVWFAAPGAATAGDRPHSARPEVSNPRISPPTAAYLELRARAHRVPSGQHERPATRPFTAAPAVSPAR